MLDPQLIEAMAYAIAPEYPDAQASARMPRMGEAAQGFEFKLLRQDTTSRSYLLRLAPGARLPAHGHAAAEESLILEGDATINGVLCRAGDYHFAPPGRPHGRITLEGGS